MTTQVFTQKKAKSDVAQETSKFVLGSVIAMASLISLWAIACLIGGLMANGFGDTIRGYISAVTGG